MNRLRQLREEKELKQTTVAADLGISRTTLSNYEAGMMPSIENGIALANYYHVSLDYIVGLSAERSTNAFFSPKLPQFSPNSLIARWKSRAFDAL